MTDYTPHWYRLISRSNDIQGGAFLAANGMHISSYLFGDPDDRKKAVEDCAELGELARQLTLDVNLGEFNTVILEGKLGYLVLLPVLDKAFLAVLARKQAKLGLVLLDMLAAIDEAFGPGLASELISPPQPPRSDSSHAKLEAD